MEFDRPQSRNEAILQNMLGANNELEPPKSRVEALLQDIAGQMPEANPSEGTTTGTLDRLKIGDEIYSVEGGSGGTTNYNNLENLPQIGGVTLKGNKTASDLGLASEEDLEEKQDVLLYGGVNPSSGEDGDMYVKLIRDESTLIDMFGSPSAESTDDYEMSYTVDSSVMGDYYDYEAFGAGKGFGQNGRGSMTITYHFKNSKFKPANVSYCNNFNLSGGGYLESANFAIKASNDGTNWDTLYSTTYPCPRDTSVSADIATNTYYSYFKFEMNSGGGYTGIRNIVMNGISESYTNIDNIYFKNDGTWLKDLFAKKSEVDAITDGTDIDSFGDVEMALAGKQDVLTAGDYVSIADDNVINVRVSKGTILNTYRFTTQNNGYAMKIEKFVKGVKMSEVQYSNEEASSIINIDGVMEFGYKYAGYLWYYKLLTDSREHITDQVVEWYYSDIVDKSENFDVASDASKNIVLQEDLTNALADKADTDIVASDFSAATSYTAGNYCIYEGKFYKFKNNHSGAWAAADVDEIKIAGELASLKSGLTNVQDDVKLNTQDLTTPSRTKNLGVSIPTASVSGVDFTAQNDGGLKVEGASTAYAYTESIFALNKGSYKVTKGNNADGGRIYVQVRNNNDDALIIEKSDASDGQFTLNEATVIKFRVAVYSGKTVNSTIYPMIRLATITDPTFAPYIPSVESRIEAVETGLNNLGKHEVLTIAANTYTSWEDALTALYTAYKTLTADQKRTAYLILDDLYVANNSTISYGYFSRTLLISSSGGYGIRVDMYALANKLAVQGALYDGEAVNIVDITANAQTNKVALYY